MSSISNIIEEFIKNLMKEENTIQIQRNELANLFNCAPSQINYVLTTRFTIEKGYHIESRKGGGGYVQIARFNQNKVEYILNIINEKLSNEISFREAKNIIDGLYEMNTITHRETQIILNSIDDKTLNIPIKGIKEKVRANILKSILVGILNSKG
jgi:transcriptional regulator of stress and heat shock response